MKNPFLPLAMLLPALVLLIPAAAPAVESPLWWQDTLAIYSPFANSGAGGPLMKYSSQDPLKALRRPGQDNPSFENLPLILEDARKLGANCIYLVDYWEPTYENKGDYVPRADLGGPEAFRKGIEAVHKQGGRIIVYLEAFIVTRTNPVGRQHPEWAMLDENGVPYTYYGRDRFYLVYPGEGSGWADYLISIAEKMVRDYGVDGFHLDSYGCQWDWKNHNPRHPGAEDPQKFNQAAVALVRNMRDRIQKINPDAIVMLECCEREELLQVCDGGQLDYAAWLHSPMVTLMEKPWAEAMPYPVFTSHFSMPENEKILKAGARLSLSPWFLQRLPEDRDFERLRRPIDERGEWRDRIITLFHFANLLHINNRPLPDVDLLKLRRDLDAAQYNPEGNYEPADYRVAVEEFTSEVRALMESGKPVALEQDHLRRLLKSKEPSAAQREGDAGVPQPE